MNLFNKIIIDEDKIYVLKLAYLEMTFLLHKNSLSISYRYYNEVSEFVFAETEKMINENLNTWTFATQYNEIILQAALPGKTILTKFNNAVFVLPKQSITSYELIPMTLDIVLPQSDNLQILSTPVSKETYTWLGETTEGEECIYDESNSYFSKEDIEYKPGFLLCPIIVENQLDTVLKLKQFPIKTDFLNIYKKNNRYRTDRIKIEYKGDESNSNLEVDLEENHKDYELVKKSRINPDSQNQIIKRLFNLTSIISER